MSSASILKIILYCLLIIINGCMPALSSEDLPVESDHPYSNNDKETWTINRSGADQMRLHFEYIRLAPDDYMKTNYDKITLSDKYNNVLAVYGNLMTSTEGINSKDFWTNWYPEDTIKVTLETNLKNFDDGFKIDDVQTRLDETNESSENIDNSIKPTIPDAQSGGTETGGNNILTATKLTSSENTSTLGQSVTLVAKVNNPSDESGEPLGTVTFMDGDTSIGIADVSSGQATLTTSSLSIGSHSITAKYSGDANFKSSTSSPFTLTVQEQLSSEGQSSTKNQPSTEQPANSEDKSSTEQNSTIKDVLVIISENQLVSGLILLLAGYFIQSKMDKK